MTQMRDEWRWVGPFLAICVGLFSVAQALGSSTGTDVSGVIGGYALHIFVLAPFVALAGLTLFIAMCAVRREPSPAKATFRFVRSRFSSPAAVFSVATALVAMPVLMGAYGVVKMLMPLSRPFTWDATLASVDRVLFWGVDPWRVTHALFGAPLPTQIIDVIYTAWVPAVMVSVLIASMATRVLRARYLLSFAAAWLLIGVVAAYALSSAGPCYAERLGTANASWFAPLMNQLTKEGVSPLNALVWQEVLWQSHVTAHYDFGRGISAAPSMHNAMCALYVFAVAKSRPIFRAGAILFAATIFVGSVHLGWHYAADGLLGWAAMAVIWKGTGTYLVWCGYSAADRPEPATIADLPAGPKPLSV